MRIQFVYPNKVSYPKDISIGLAYLSAVLKSKGHEVSLIDTTFGMSDSQIISGIQQFAPDLVAVSAVSNNFEYAVDLSKLMKKHFELPIIIGGIHATIAPEETISKDCFDMVCIGEGEEALAELVESMEKGERNTTIENIWFKDVSGVIRNPLRKLCENLDTIPFADTEFFDYNKYLKQHNMVASFLSSRGCPYKCAYCINHSLQELYSGLGSYVRYRSVDDVITEMESAIKKYDIRAISFYDDTFTLNKNRVREFCEKYKKRIDLPFYINARIDNITEQMCIELREAGCERASIGLESGDPQIREQILKKNVSDEQIISGCRLLKEHGIKLYTYNMIGIPGENIENIRKTIKLNRKIRPDFLMACIFTAFKNTELYDRCEEEGILDQSKSTGSYFTGSNVLHPHLSRRKLLCIQKWFGFNVFIAYDVKRALIDLLDRHLITNKFYSRFRSMLSSIIMSHLRARKERSREVILPT